MSCLVKFPCKDCSDRYLGCHGKCEKYKEANDKNIQANIAFSASIDSSRSLEYTTMCMVNYHPSTDAVLRKKRDKRKI